MFSVSVLRVFPKISLTWCKTEATDVREDTLSIAVRAQDTLQEAVVSGKIDDAHVISPLHDRFISQISVG